MSSYLPLAINTTDDTLKQYLGFAVELLITDKDLFDGGWPDVSVDIPIVGPLNNSLAYIHSNIKKFIKIKVFHIPILTFYDILNGHSPNSKAGVTTSTIGHTSTIPFPLLDRVPMGLYFPTTNN